MGLRFDNRVVIVTGAGAGLGREYALLFASRGAKVVVNDLGGNFHGEGKSNAADLVVKEIIDAGGIAVANYNSVTDGEKIIETAMASFGRVDVLVNNAGILRDKSLVNITDKDWDQINDIHLKASFITTRAAWPIFKKQNFGRVIMTSSNSGVYGNFGQANYSAAKLGVVGLANTVAIEGAKYNIHCNVIVPTAASRMTKDVLPEEFYNELKPKLIAPVVVYLCHESNTDNGSIIESAAGWATKVHFVRGKGSLLRTSITESVTPEFVRDKWSNVTDMSQAARVDSIAEASGSLMGMLEELKDASGNSMAKSKVYEDKFSYRSRDLILYALGIGFSVEDEVNLRFLYENDPSFEAFPTYSIIPGLIMSMTSDLVSSALTSGFDLTQVLHGEQYVELLRPLPTDCDLTTRGSIVDVLDKKSGAVVVTLTDTYDPSGNHLIRNQSSTFIVGAGNFGGKSKPNEQVVACVPNPSRNPDATISMKTTLDQAALYRLSGDYNPMHIDPSFAAIGGFKKPILHGLCTLGVSVRAIMKQYANNDASLFKAMKVRFSKPVYPGETLKVDMWQEGTRIHFKTTAVESNLEVLTGAFVDLHKVVQSQFKPESTIKSNMPSMNSDAVFAAIKDRVAADPAKAKAINAVFLYKITKDGSVAKEWTLDLKNASVVEGPPKGKADTTLTVSDDDFVEIALGKLNPQTAFMKGKLKITGNIMLTQKLVPLLKTEAKL
ncbi:unnamed protein product [Diamesa hyperborea]